MMAKRRASDILEECISLVFSGQETIESVLAIYPEYAEQIRPELEVAIWLNNQRTVSSARPGFIAASGKHLVSQLKQENQAAPVAPPRFRWNPAFLGLAIATVFLFISVFAFQGGVRWVNQSVPGDPGYSLKIGIENAQLSLTDDPVREVKLRIAFAERRAHEIEILIEKNRFEVVESVFTTYRENLSIAGDLIANLEVDPNVQAELAQNLANVVAVSNESFSAILVAGSDLPSSLVVVFSDVITFGDTTIAAMVAVLDDLGRNWNPPPGVTVKPTATLYSSPTSTDLPTNTPKPTKTLKPTSTPKPTKTLVPTATLEPTATWDPLTPTPTATWDPSIPTSTPTDTPPPPPPPADDDDDGDDEIKPTKKPSKTPKPTKTPKDKDK
jgi:hypothetical protein